MRRTPRPIPATGKYIHFERGEGFVGYYDGWAQTRAYKSPLDAEAALNEIVYDLLWRTQGETVDNAVEYAEVA